MRSSVTATPLRGPRHSAGLIDRDASDDTGSDASDDEHIPNDASAVLSPRCLEAVSVRGITWTSLARYLIACELEPEAGREAVRRAPSFEAAKDIAAQHKKKSDWEDVCDSLALDGLRARCTQSLNFLNALKATQSKTLVVEYEDEHWGAGAHGLGQNRLGHLLCQVRSELSMPDFVPKELVDDPVIYGKDFTVDNFLSRLTHRLLEYRKPGDTESLAVKFEALFSCTADLLKLRRQRCYSNLTRKEERLSDVHEAFFQELQVGNRNGAISMLDEAENQIGRLQDCLTQVTNSTGPMGKRLAVIDRQISRAKEGKELVEHFDFFNAVSPNEMNEYVEALKELTQRNRAQKAKKRLREVIRKTEQDLAQKRREEGDDDVVSDVDSDDDDDEDAADEEDQRLEEIRSVVQNFPLPSVFALGVYASGITEYTIEKRCVEAVKKLKLLVTDWAAKRAGVQNVKTYEQFVSRVLLDELQSLQEGIVDAVQRRGSPEHVSSHFETPLQIVVGLLTDMGHADATFEKYVDNVLVAVLTYSPEIYRTNVRPPGEFDDEVSPFAETMNGTEIPKRSVSDDADSEPPTLSSELRCLFSVMESTLKREIGVARKIFADPQPVLKRVIERFVATGGTDRHVGLAKLISFELEKPRRQLVLALRVQDIYKTFGNINSLYEHGGILARRPPNAPPLSPQSNQYYRYARILPIEPRPLNRILQVDLGVYNKKLCMLHTECQNMRTRLAALAQECAETLQLHVADIFSDGKRTFQTSETRWLESFFYSQADPFAMQDVSSLTVFARKGMRAAQESLSRCCPLLASQPEKQELVAKQLADILMTNICKRVKEAVVSTIGPVKDELRRLPSVPGADIVSANYKESSHIPALQAVCCAVTAIEMLDDCLKTRFASVLIRKRADIHQLRQRHLEELERLMGEAIAAASGLLAAKALSILLKHQKKSDFSPRNAAGTSQPTLACQKYSAYLDVQLRETKTALAGSLVTLRSASKLIAHLLSRGIYAHLKAFTVSEEGALQLKRDVTEYCSVMTALGSEYSEPFELLRDLSNLFLVAPACLKDVTREGRLAEQTKDELLEFLSMRADWKEIKKTGIFA
ncbi:Exocyst complex component SEC10 [Diplonema papillatum]|nr:Exocyst complex component SEC10 [Diplonema papillatum]